MEEKYNAGLMSQSFWFIEFKKIVDLYSKGVDFDEIKRQCIDENLFGAINPNRERRMCGYLLTRLRSMDDKLVSLFVSADITTQKLINLITIMNTNRLFLEFVYEVYRNKLIVGESSIDLKDGNVFFAQKESQNEDLASWSESTKKKLRTLFLNLLIEADLVRWTDEKKKNRIINRVFINMELENYLKNNNISIYNAIAGEN
ncbi:DUF1819 family protein [Ruminococcus sp.]|uniref:DUF1819 family protein n=1 Tax=Ruminococcus sp. TaxID=41978 RepID=UPI00258BB898|nr:DUF1819 family protein [Ruminococcus sp.]MCR5021591.1 DUF1819 family protein [Ruminococcus sp.]